jgi:hypothetical protein
MVFGLAKLMASVHPVFDVGKLMLDGGLESSVTESAMMAAAE